MSEERVQRYVRALRGDDSIVDLNELAWAVNVAQPDIDPAREWGVYVDMIGVLVDAGEALYRSLQRMTSDV